MNDRPYRGAADLTRLQHFNATQIAANPVGWLQPGDIPHRLYNGYREHDPAQLLHIWEDDAGEIVGWAFTYPDDAFDIQAHNPVVVVVAPDGRFAAFAVTWHDSHNRTGYFEPVGTHADFLRRGLARAVMLYAMRAMQSAGLVTAIVIHEPPEENPAPAGLYRGLGFQTQYTTHLYHKTRL